MGKPFARELAVLAKTYDWALRFPIGALAQAIGRYRSPLIAVGSGGSYSAAQMAVLLHQERFALPAVAATPLEISSTDLDLAKAAVLLLTAGGNNSDILGAFDVSIRGEARHLTIVCASKGSKLAARANQFASCQLCEFALPSGRDGFLATNSLLATCVLLHRAYTSSYSASAALPNELGDLAGASYGQIDYARLLSTETLLVLYPPQLKPVAVDIESKFTEAALGNVQLADYRQFAHGRHHWLAKRGGRSTLLALGTASTAEIVEKTLKFIPKDVRSLRLLLPHEGSIACLSGLLHGYELVRQAGKARGIDPGDPKVPSFGRKLYHLKVFGRTSARDQKVLASPEVAIARKTAEKQSSNPHAADWKKAHSEFLDRLRLATILALVVDYDGTLCDEAKRYESLSEPISTELKRLLRAGIVLGVATGRGKSIRERLREVLPKSLWSRVVVGYYNGGDVGLLSDDSNPDGTPEVSESLRSAEKVIRRMDKFLGIAEVECRRKQISLRPTEAHALDGLWRNIEGEFRKASLPGVTVLMSGHSIDILAPNVSKLAVVDHVASISKGRKDQVLCIGDQGSWPGNDHELLGTPLSLSVGAASADPERCWNLAPVGLRESQATLCYLKRLRVSSRGGQFDLSGTPGRKA